jgi:hypothetical protein
MASMRGPQFLTAALASACEEERKSMFWDPRAIARMTTTGAQQPIQWTLLHGSADGTQ